MAASSGTLRGARIRSSLRTCDRLLLMARQEQFQAKFVVKNQGVARSTLAGLVPTTLCPGVAVFPSRHSSTQLNPSQLNPRCSIFPSGRSPPRSFDGVRTLSAHTLRRGCLIGLQRNRCAGPTSLKLGQAIVVSCLRYAPNSARQLSPGESWLRLGLNT